MNDLLIPNRILHAINSKPKSLSLATNFLMDYFVDNIPLFLEFLDQFFKALTEDVSEDSIAAAAKGLALLSPICEKFGLYQEKVKLEALCFERTNPVAHKALSDDFEEFKEHADKWIKQSAARLNEVLSRHGFHCNISGRYKELYSIHLKLRKKGLSRLSQLNDLFGLRVVTQGNNENECYEILNLLHDEFYPVPKRFKDYVIVPKINGYQSIHTGLRGILPEYENSIEVQIRTPLMHQFAENGLAAHWIYTRSKHSNLLTEKGRALKENLSIKVSENSEKIHVLTYKGDLIPIKKETTCLDLAYFIHTDLGHHAQSAEVNGIESPLSTVLKNGDLVKIVEGKTGLPTEEQFKIFTTQHAKTKLKALTKKHPQHV